MIKEIIDLLKGKLTVSLIVEYGFKRIFKIKNKKC